MRNALERQERLLTRPFVASCLIVLLTAFGLQIINATQAMYVRAAGLPAVCNGWIVTAFTAVSIAARLVFGPLSDRKGRRAIVLIGNLLFGAAALLTAGCTALAPLLALAAVRGLGSSMQNTANQAAALDVTPKRRMGEGVGYLGLGTVLATALAPAAGIALNEKSGALPLLCGGALCLAAAAAAFGIPKKPAQPAAQPPKPAGGIWGVLEKGALGPAAVQMAAMMAFAAVIYYLAQFGAQRGYGAIGAFFTVSAVSTLAVRLWGGRLMDRLSPARLLFPAGAAGVALFLILGLSRSQALIVASGLLYGFSNGVTTLVLNTLAVRRAAPQRMGAASSTYLLSIDLGLCLGSLVWGALLERGGLEMVFLLCGALFAVLTAAACTIFRRSEKQKKEKENR